MTRTLLTAGVAWLALAALAPAARSEDEVIYNDRAAKNPAASVKGTIQKESPRGVEIKAGSAVKVIAPGDVVEVVYPPPKDIPRVEFRKPFITEDRALKATRDEERRDLLRQAANQYHELAPKLSENKGLQTYVHYRAAALLGRLAEEEPEAAARAEAELKTFADDHPDGWQITLVLDQLGRLYDRRKDYAAAQKLYEGLADRKDVPPEVKQAASVAVARYLIRAKKADLAEKRLQELKKEVPPNDPLAAKLQVYLAECLLGNDKLPEAEKLLKTVADGPGDAGIKALACNTLGDLYQKSNRAEDAFWQYLWVDVLYNQDMEEHARALYHLAKLFQAVKKDPARAKQCLERLKEKQFTGLEWQKLAGAEGK